MHYICSRIRSYKSINIVSVPDVHIECVVRSTSTCGCGCVKLNNTKNKCCRQQGGISQSSISHVNVSKITCRQRIELLNFA